MRKKISKTGKHLKVLSKHVTVSSKHVKVSSKHVRVSSITLSACLLLFFVAHESLINIDLSHYRLKYLFELRSKPANDTEYCAYVFDFAARRSRYTGIMSSR